MSTDPARVARRGRLGIVLMAVALFSPLLTASAGAVTTNGLDPSFGTGGVVDSGPGYAQSSLTQPDGKILVLAGHFQAPTPPYVWHWDVYRLLPDGSPDLSFASNGHKEFSLSTGSLGAETGIALDSRGRILVAGNDGSNGTLVYRLTASGRSDNTFGRRGVARVALSGTQQRGLGVLSTGEIIVEGSFDLVKLSPRGALVLKVTPQSFIPGGGGAGLVVQPDDKIVAGGAAYSGWQVNLVRYLPDLSPDPAFNGGQPVTETFSAGPAPNALAVQQNGDVVMAGNSGSQTFVYRYHADGTPDASLRYSGFLVDSPIYGEYPRSVVSLPDASLIVMVNGDPFAASSLVRFSPGGAQDTTFGTNGLLTTADMGGNGQKSDMTPYDAGRVLIAGGGDALTGRYIVNQ